jgi:hypothetical protein
MDYWLHNLPLPWMAVVVFGATYLVAGSIHLVAGALAVGDRTRAFKAISPGMLSPLGILFGLFVAFTAAQVWNDTDRANMAVNREASSLRSVLVLATIFPGEPESQLRGFVSRYVQEAATQEWPMLAQHSASLGSSAAPLIEALRFTLALPTNNSGQQTAQRELITSVESALDARRQRILISRSEVNVVKWVCLILQAACALLAIALVHSDHRVASLFIMGIFATGVAASILLILAHDRPFVGQLAIRPEPLLQIIS